MRNIIIGCLLLVYTLIISGCGAKRPVLYPNEHLKAVGNEMANQAVDDCFRLATEYQAGGNRSRDVAKDTGKAAVVGTATGGVIGAITGNLRQGAIIGGAGAATAALGSGIIRSDEPDPIFKKFVEQCLREKGFQSLGWR